MPCYVIENLWICQHCLQNSAEITRAYKSLTLSEEYCFNKERKTQHKLRPISAVEILFKYPMTVQPNSATVTSLSCFFVTLQVDTPKQTSRCRQNDWREWKHYFASYLYFVYGRYYKIFLYYYFWHTFPNFKPISNTSKYFLRYPVRSFRVTFVKTARCE